MRPGKTEARVKVGYAVQLVILVLFLATVLLGIFPNVLLDYIDFNFNFEDLFTIGNGMF